MLRFAACTWLAIHLFDIVMGELAMLSTDSIQTWCGVVPFSDGTDGTTAQGLVLANLLGVMN